MFSRLKTGFLTCVILAILVTVSFSQEKNKPIYFKLTIDLPGKNDRSYFEGDFRVRSGNKVLIEKNISLRGLKTEKDRTFSADIGDPGSIDTAVEGINWRIRGVLYDSKSKKKFEPARMDNIKSRKSIDGVGFEIIVDDNNNIQTKSKIYGPDYSNIKPREKQLVKPGGPEHPVSKRLSGIELYNKLKTDRNLIKFEGTGRLQWTSDGDGYVIRLAGSFKKSDLKSGKVSSLFNETKILSAFNKLTGKSINKIPFRSFRYFDKGAIIRFKTDPKSREVYFYNLNSGKMILRNTESLASGVRGRRYEEKFSSDLKFSAFSKNNNMYLKDSDGKITSLTSSGSKDLLNGTPDWVYAEELNQYEAFWWSPDSKKILYIQFDEKNVTKYPILHESENETTVKWISYPKAGKTNPVVRLFIFDVYTKKTVQIDTGEKNDVYIFDPEWTPDGKEVFYKRLNRMQNKLVIAAANPVTGKSRIVIQEEESCFFNEYAGSAWESNEVVFLKDNKHFIRSSERSGYKEIYLYKLSGGLVKQLTSKKLPVGSIISIDEKNKCVYFSGYEKRGTEKHLYKVRLNGTEFTKLTTKPGTHNISMAPGSRYYTDSFSSFYEMPEINIHNITGKLIKNAGKMVLTEKFRKLKLTDPEHFIFKSANGKYDLDGILYKPANFDKDKNYPLIFSVYGYPGVKMVNNRITIINRENYLAQLGFLVVKIDNRGLPKRGKSFEDEAYGKLGDVILADHVSAVKQLAERPYVDAGRVGIYGHSGGGSTTCFALLKKPDIFHVGVAGAPVTDWRFYDSILSERYMGTPENNKTGYENNSLMNYAKNLEGKLYLHHGSVDDNVHPANTMILVEALLKAGKMVDMMIYPGQDHGIYSSQYEQKRVEYFIKHLKPETYKEWFGTKIETTRMRELRENQ